MRRGTVCNGAFDSDTADSNAILQCDLFILGRNTLVPMCICTLFYKMKIMKLLLGFYMQSFFFTFDFIDITQ